MHDIDLHSMRGAQLEIDCCGAPECSTSSCHSALCCSVSRQVPRGPRQPHPCIPSPMPSCQNPNKDGMRMPYAPGRLLAYAGLGDFDFNWLPSIYCCTTCRAPLEHTPKVVEGSLVGPFWSHPPLLSTHSSSPAAAPNLEGLEWLHQIIKPRRPQ